MPFLHHSQAFRGVLGSEEKSVEGARIALSSRTQLGTPRLSAAAAVNTHERVNTAPAPSVWNTNLASGAHNHTQREQKYTHGGADSKKYRIAG